MLEALKRTVARVELDGRPNGTAFLVDRKHVATALHVLGRSSTVDLVFVEWPVGDRKRVATRTWRHPAYDVAILELDRECPTGVHPLPWAAAPATGARWSTFGFPAQVSDGYPLVDERITDPSLLIEELELRILHLHTLVAQYDLGGFSGAPCAVGGAIIGVIAYQLRRTPPGGAEQIVREPSLHTLYALPITLLAGSGIVPPLTEQDEAPGRSPRAAVPKQSTHPDHPGQELVPPIVQSYVQIDVALAARLLADMQALKSVAVCGTSGAGKSTLAAQVAWDYRASGSGPIYWIEHSSNIPLMLEGLGIALGVSVAELRTIPQRTAALRRVSDGRRAMFVFDDVSDEEVASALLDTVGRGNAILITGLHAGLRSFGRHGVRVSPISLLAPSAAEVVLDRLLGTELSRNTELEQLLEIAAGHPLSLVLLAGELRALSGYAEERIGEFVETAKQTRGVVLRESGARTISALSPDALRLFGCLHIFAAENIPIDAWEAVANPEGPFEVASSELVKRLLVTRHDDHVRAHAYIRNLSRESTSASKRSELLEHYKMFHLKLAKQFGGYEWNIRSYPRLIPYESDLLLIFDLLLLDWDDNVEHAWQQCLLLAHHLSWYLYWRGYRERRYEMCFSVLERLDALQESSWSNLVGNLYVDKGWMALGRSSYEEAADDAERALALLDATEAFFAQELKYQALLETGHPALAVEGFRELCRSVPEQTRSWYVLMVRLADAYGSAGDGPARSKILSQLLKSCAAPPRAESLDDVHARIMYRYAVEELERGETASGKARLGEALALFARAQKVDLDRVAALCKMATLAGLPGERRLLLEEALRHANTLGIRKTIEDVSKMMDIPLQEAP